MKLHLYITDLVRFAEGKIDFCAESDRHMDDTWLHVAEIDVNLDIDNEAITQGAIQAITKEEENQRAEHNVKMNLLAEKKQSLLAIEHKRD